METYNTLIEFCKKWESLGIKTTLLKMDGQIGSKKLIRRYDVSNLEDDTANKLSDDPNFVAILIRDT